MVQKFKNLERAKIFKHVWRMKNENKKAWCSFEEVLNTFLGTYKDPNSNKLYYVWLLCSLVARQSIEQQRSVIHRRPPFYPKQKGTRNLRNLTLCDPFWKPRMIVNDPVMCILNIYLRIKIIFPTKLYTYYLLFLTRNELNCYSFSNANFKKLFRDGQKRMIYLKLDYHKMWKLIANLKNIFVHRKFCFVL